LFALRCCKPKNAYSLERRGLKGSFKRRLKRCRSTNTPNSAGHAYLTQRAACGAQRLPVLRDWIATCAAIGVDDTVRRDRRDVACTAGFRRGQFPPTAKPVVPLPGLPDARGGCGDCATRASRSPAAGSGAVGTDHWKSANRLLTRNGGTVKLCCCAGKCGPNVGRAMFGQQFGVEP
jgi:hypothetical protein